MIEEKGEKKIVIPGEEIEDSMEVLPGFGTYRDGKKIYSKFIGVLRKNGRVISVTPLAGKYNPRVGDYVIGEVKEVSYNFWIIDINSPYRAIMPIAEGSRDFIERNADLTKYYNIGDLILCGISGATPTKHINVTMKDSKCRKLIDGFVMNISPSKIPRLIGKGGSMIQTIKEGTDCFITAGQNGRVWINGGNVEKAAEAVNFVNEFSHINGLTEKITKMLKGGKDEKEK